MKTIGQGTKVLSFSLAETLGWGDKKRTQWFRCSMFGERGEKLAQYLKKGTAITVTGEMEMRAWQKDGVEKNSLEIRVDRLALMGGGEKRQEQQPPANDWSQDEVPF
jgi:single-strand DNA-binding protein